MKKIFVKSLLFLFVLFLCGTLFCGCSRVGVSHQITSYPTKVVYQIGETPNFEGLRIETINNDGTHTKFHFTKNDVSQVDTSTAGVKKVKVAKGDMSVSFNIYVANVVVNDSDNLKDIFEDLNDGDIVYLREGTYKPSSANDDSFQDIVINKSVTIVGDGINKTKFFGNFILGAELKNGVLTKLESFMDVSFFNIGFELDYEIENGFVNYNGPYKKSNTNGAIRFFDIENLQVSNCSFKGYGYGIFGENVTGLKITKSTFKNIFKNAIKITGDIQNSSILNNVFMDISSGVVAFDENYQSWLGAIYLNFSKKGERGVIIAKNNFARIGLKNGDTLFFDEESKNLAQNTTINLFNGSYLNNSSAIILLSSAEDDLEVSGIVLSNNNYSGVYESVYMGAKSTNTINQNGVLILD